MAQHSVDEREHNSATDDEYNQPPAETVDYHSQGVVLGLKPKPEFLPLFNLGEPVTTGDAANALPTRRATRWPPMTFRGFAAEE